MGGVERVCNLDTALAPTGLGTVALGRLLNHCESRYLHRKNR